MELTAPLYPKLKSQGITNWMFHTPEPDMAVFLRLHNPTKFGDHLNRFMDKQVARTQPWWWERAGQGRVCGRILRPVDDGRGDWPAMSSSAKNRPVHSTNEKPDRRQLRTSAQQEICRPPVLADSSAVWKRRDNWDDNPNFVVADKTTPTDKIIQFHGDLASVPARGGVLERFHDGDSVFVRGIFPIHDAAGNTVGAMFVYGTFRPSTGRWSARATSLCW